jgi:hypothetical protein
MNPSAPCLHPSSSFFLPRDGSVDLPPAALTEWALTLDPALPRFFAKAVGALPTTHAELLAWVNVSLWRSPRDIPSVPAHRVPFTCSLRSPAMRLGTPKHELRDFDLLDVALVIRMDERPLFATRYALEVSGVDCGAWAWENYNARDHDAPGKRQPVVAGRTYAAVVTTAAAAAAAATGPNGGDGTQQPLSRLGGGSSLWARPPPAALLPTWKQLSAGREIRTLRGCAAGALGIVPRSHVTDTPCPYPDVTFDSWTVRGRVRFPSAVTPWLPALAFELASARNGAILHAVSAEEGSLDVELFAPCTDLAGLVSYSWDEEGRSGDNDASGGPQRVEAAILQGRSLGHGARPGWHYISLLARGPATVSALDAEVIVPLSADGRSFASVELGCRSSLFHVGPLLRSAWLGVAKPAFGRGGWAYSGDAPLLLVLAAFVAIAGCLQCLSCLRCLRPCTCRCLGPSCCCGGDCAAAAVPSRAVRHSLAFVTRWSFIVLSTAARMPLWVAFIAATCYGLLMFWFITGPPSTYR